jgi:hypothetical protein
MVSRASAPAWREGDELVVRDRGSSNGTFVGARGILAMMILISSLAGCEMITGSCGDISGQYVFHRPEVLSEDYTLIEEGEDPWRLSEGEGVMTLDLTSLVTSLEGEEERRS